MNDTNKKIDDLLKAERRKKIKIVLGITAVFVLMVCFTLAMEGGANM
ncbi:Uncharacterised protein [BD1-7 clade bacterium]|uniref:Uncharacterized protein n=1 Tax=BD1-7 clade bacterium TaxID=2029982 RepID=A0A5S9PHE8_9GAMM|nr:Uncharacterised protein [BD1-7 clade bacterium]CAA0103503.1 Uncharacterised protein [BD1-7 clade bacterium]